MPKLYTTQQAATQLGISDGRLRQLIAAGVARPKENLGGTWMFTSAEVARLLTRPRRPGRPRR